MTQILGILVALAIIAFLSCFLYVFVRFSVVSSLKTKGARERLRHPEPDGIESLCGYPPPVELVDFYRRSPLVESVEFYLVDRTQVPPAFWSIGAFSPLTPADVTENRIVSGVSGIPIADDLGKGMYYVARDGTIMLLSPNLPGQTIEVAPDIGTFAGFDPVDGPPGEGQQVAGEG